MPSTPRDPSPPQSEHPPAQAEGTAVREIPPAARRALAEAEERRRAQAAAAPPREVGGRDGPEPTRYGDWEKDGIASDF